MNIIIFIFGQKLAKCLFLIDFSLFHMDCPKAVVGQFLAAFSLYRKSQ